MTRSLLISLMLCGAMVALSVTSARGQSSDQPDAPDQPAEPPKEDPKPDAASDQPEKNPAEAEAPDDQPDANPSASDESSEAESAPAESDHEAETDQPEKQPVRAKHPSELEFPELSYDVPSREGMRQVLANGMVLWWSQEEKVAGLPPLFRLSAVVRASTLSEPAEKAGMVALAVGMMREGGTAKYPRAELFKELELRAATITTGASEEAVTVSLTCLDGDRDKGLELFDEVLRRPAFNQDDLNRRKGQVRENLKQRNTTPADIEAREWNRLLYAGHPHGTYMTRDSLKEITREDLVNWHKNLVAPQNIMLYGSGSLTAEAAKTQLDALFAEWAAGEQVNQIAPAQPEQSPAAAVYLMDRDQEQAHVRIGHLSYQRDQEDYYALMLMNFALGGGGFSSRITQNVRVKNGLSYISYSRFTMPENYTGTFYAACQTKNETAAFAAKLMIDEINRMYADGISAEELNVAKQYYLGSFPQRFAEPGSTAQIFGMGEYYGRPEGYQENWREKLEAVSVEDVAKVAKKYLQPEKLVIYILGKADAVRKGNPNDAENATTLEDLGMEITPMSLPDPESLTVKEE